MLLSSPWRQLSLILAEGKLHFCAAKTSLKDNLIHRCRGPPSPTMGRLAKRTIDLLRIVQVRFTLRRGVKGFPFFVHPMRGSAS